MRARTVSPGSLESVAPGQSAGRSVLEKTYDFMPGIPPPPCVRAASKDLRPSSTVSKREKSSLKSISGSITIQSASPFGPAM